MFQQRHFEVIAIFLRNDTGLPVNSPEWRNLVDSMTLTMARHNPKFNRAKFHAACGVFDHG